MIYVYILSCKSPVGKMDKHICHISLTYELQTMCMSLIFNFFIISYIDIKKLQNIFLKNKSIMHEGVSYHFVCK